MLYENLVSSFMLILGAGGMVFVQSFTKEIARIMPECAFGIMIIFSVITLVNNLMHAKTAAGSKLAKAAKNTDEKSAAEWKRFWMLFFIKFAIILFFFVTFPRINYFIMAPITIIAVALLSGVSWKLAIPVAAISTVAIYGIFVAWLNVFI